MNVTVLADPGFWALVAIAAWFVAAYIRMEWRSVRDVEDDPMGDLP